MQISPTPGQAAPTCLSAVDLEAALWSVVMEFRQNATDAEIREYVARPVNKINRENEIVFLFLRYVIQAVGGGVYQIIDSETKERKLMTYAMIEEIVINKL